MSAEQVIDPHAQRAAAASDEVDPAMKSLEARRQEMHVVTQRLRYRRVEQDEAGDSVVGMTIKHRIVGTRA
jgi:hypothetical protein